LIEEGKLPNLRKLVASGIHSRNCVTDFPSITYPTQVSMITGTYTGDYRNELCHGVPSFNWMDRGVSPPILRSYGSYGYKHGIELYKLNEDMGDNCKTVLEMLEEENTASIAQFINRGAQYFFPERKSKLAMYYVLIKYLGNIKKFMIRANTVTVKKLLETFKNPKKHFNNKDQPICSLLLFFSSDILMHLYGPNSEAYELNLIHIDKSIGMLINELNKIGYLEDTAIAISSDHGNYKAGLVGTLNSFFQKSSLSHYHPRKNPKGNMNIAEFGSVGFFNFKSDKNKLTQNWAHPLKSELEKYGPKKLNLFEELFKINGSTLMYYADDENSYSKGKIHLRKRDVKTGKVFSGLIEYNGTGNEFKAKYSTDVPDHDIFGYTNQSRVNKILDNKFHDTQEWLAATFHIDYPLYPALLPRHFKNPRGADIIISTQGNITYNIKHGTQKNQGIYLHDIGLSECSVVPLIIGGSNELPINEIPFCKTTDIVPTLLKMIGKKPHESVVGKCLI